MKRILLAIAKVLTCQLVILLLIFTFTVSAVFAQPQRQASRGCESCAECCRHRSECCGAELRSGYPAPARDAVGAHSRPAESPPIPGRRESTDRLITIRGEVTDVY
jgi:hypothetical protein